MQIEESFEPRKSWTGLITSAQPMVDWISEAPTASELSEKYLKMPVVLLHQHTHYHIANSSGQATQTKKGISPDLEREFNERADRWEAQTGIYSSPTKCVLHKDYQIIMTMGAPVLPLILRRLETKPGDWFWALKHFARKDVAETEVTFEGAVAAWLKWGREMGHI